MYVRLCVRSILRCRMGCGFRERSFLDRRYVVNDEDHEDDTSAVCMTPGPSDHIISFRRTYTYISGLSLDLQVQVCTFASRKPEPSISYSNSNSDAWNSNWDGDDRTVRRTNTDWGYGHGYGYEYGCGRSSLDS